MTYVAPLRTLQGDGAAFSYPWVSIRCWLGGAGKCAVRRRVRYDAMLQLHVCYLMLLHRAAVLLVVSEKLEGSFEKLLDR
jgi:hypothetical protein